MGPGIELGCLRSRETAALATPNRAQVALAYAGGPVYLVWADDQGVHQCEINADGEFEGPKVLVDDRPDTSHIQALRVGGTTWVAYGASDQPIRVFQAHRPHETLAQLSGEGRTLLGAPLLADAGQGVMVFGQTPDGYLAWQVSPQTLGVLNPFMSIPTDFLCLTRWDHPGSVIMRFEVGTVRVCDRRPMAPCG